jgi:DNA modification methylase
MKIERPQRLNKSFIIAGDSREKLKPFCGAIDLIVTSPPYADARKKHYGGIHPSNFANWFLTFNDVFWDALKPDGSLVINIKDKVVDGARHRFVWQTIDRLCDKGWKCIDDYIWHKTNPMPGYWPTRLRDGWEYCFHLAKSIKPYINQDDARVPIGDWVKTRLQKLGKNDLQRHDSVNDSGFGRDISKWVGKNSVLPSNVLSVPLVGKNKGHPAVFPLELPSFFIRLLSRPGSLIADPFGGSGTTAIAALLLGRDCVLIDSSIEYCKLAHERVTKECQRQSFEIFLDGFKDKISERQMTRKAVQMVLDLHQTTAPYVVQRRH